MKIRVGMRVYHAQDTKYGFGFVRGIQRGRKRALVVWDSGLVRNHYLSVIRAVAS